MEKIQTVEFWTRAQETARLVVGDIAGFVIDPRLREIAKGARQEYPKSCEYERALQDRRNLGLEIPFLENAEDAWDRSSSWMSSVVSEALQEEQDPSPNSPPQSQRVYNVLVVSGIRSKTTPSKCGLRN
jgi:broad specificity phosphatase PhoE